MQSGRLNLACQCVAYEPVKGLNVSPSFFVMTFIYEFIPDSLNMTTGQCLIKVR